MDSVSAAFKAHLLARGLAVSTVVSYLGGLSSFIKWYREMSGEFDLAAVTQLDVADYRQYLLAEGNKPATVNHALDVLRSFLAWVVQERLVQGNPVDGVKGVPSEKEAPRWLGRKSLGALVRTVQRHGTARDRALIAFLIQHRPAGGSQWMKRGQLGEVARGTPEHHDRESSACSGWEEQRTMEHRNE